MAWVGGAPTLLIVDNSTLASDNGAAQSGKRFAQLIGTCIALLLAATGVYGLMSYCVALGAPFGDVLLEILHEGLKMLLRGAVFGVIGALP